MIMFISHSVSNVFMKDADVEVLMLLKELGVLAPTIDRPWYGHQLVNGMVVVVFGMETNRGVLERCVPDSALVINDGTGWTLLAAAA